MREYTRKLGHDLCSVNVLDYAASEPGGSHIMLGGEAGLALGPVGRSGEVCGLP